MGIDAGVFLFAAILILTVPIPWLASSVIAAAVHECFHVGAILLQGGRIRGICIGSGGTVIHTDLQERRKELYATIAGPVGSFLVAGLYTQVPKISFCALVQGAFNLLPLYPLDGGRILSCICEIVMPEYADRIVCTVARITKCVIGLGFFYFLCYGHPSVTLGFGFILLLRIFLRKIPCKPG